MLIDGEILNILYVSRLDNEYFEIGIFNDKFLVNFENYMYQFWTIFLKTICTNSFIE